MLSIKNNLMASNAARHLGGSYDNLSTSVERLSSGLRINSAKDDAAGLAVRELVRADIATLDQGSRNASDAISMLQTAEGAMGNIDEVLIRMKELAEQAATDSYSSAQREIMNNEFDQLAEEITRVAESTTFNEISLLDPSSDNTEYNIHVGTDTTIDITAQQMTRDSTALGLGSTGTKASYTNVNGVADAGGTWFTQSGDETLDLQFGAGNGDDEEAAVSISLDDGEDYSLNDIVNMINQESQSESNYNMASVNYDSTSNVYHLNLTAAESGDNKTLSISDSDTSGNVPAVMDDVATDFSGSDGTDGSGAVSIEDKDEAVAALSALDSAIKNKDTYRAKLGYLMNRLESAVSVLQIQSENLSSAESRISDVDVATEMATMTRNQVLAQSGISMLSQANNMPQMALQLLQG